MWRWFKHKLSAQLFESTNARMARLLLSGTGPTLRCPQWDPLCSRRSETGTALPPDRTLPAPSALPSPLLDYLRDLDYLRVLHGMPLNQLYPSPLAESRLVFSQQPDGSVGEWQCDEEGTA
jgi:hypothetical protein